MDPSMAPKAKRMKETDLWELQALPLILPFCYITLCSNRGSMEGHSVGQYQSSWSTEKREPANEKGEEIPREDRQHIHTKHGDGNR